MTRYSLIEYAVACVTPSCSFVHTVRRTRLVCYWFSTLVALVDSQADKDRTPGCLAANTTRYRYPGTRVLFHTAALQRFYSTTLWYSAVYAIAAFVCPPVCQSVCSCGPSAMTQLLAPCNVTVIFAFIIMQYKARIKYEAMKGDLTKSTHRSHLEVSFVLINRAIQDKIGDCYRAVKCLKLRRCKMPQWRSKQQHAARLGIRLDITHRACW